MAPEVASCNVAGAGLPEHHSARVDAHGLQKVARLAAAVPHVYPPALCRDAIRIPPVLEAQNMSPPMPTKAWSFGLQAFFSRLRRSV